MIKSDSYKNYIFSIKIQILTIVKQFILWVSVNKIKFLLSYLDIIKGVIQMNLQQNLSNYLNAIRRHKNQSLTEFSQEIGVARSTLQELLRGTGNPRLDTIQVMADGLGVHSMELLSSEYSQQQIQFAYILLETIKTFSSLPKEKKTTAAYLFHELIMMMEDEQVE